MQQLGLAGGGKPAAEAMEKVEADLLFQFAQFAADRRLRRAQGFGRRGHALAHHHGVEDFYLPLVQTHAASPIHIRTEFENNNSVFLKGKWFWNHGLDTGSWPARRGGANSAMRDRQEPRLETGRFGLGYREAMLHIEDACLGDIAARVATPFYCYSSAAIRSAYERLSQALAPVGASICFAVKANGNLSILSLLAESGCGMDIVSGGELERVLAAGIPGSRVVFSGVGKKAARSAARSRPVSIRSTSNRPRSSKPSSRQRASSA